VLIIGVGNTAMDCCRSAKRLGATEVKVIARRRASTSRRRRGSSRTPRKKAVEIVENLQPVRFIIENGKLTGMEIRPVQVHEVNGKLEQQTIGRITIPCDSVVLAIGQDNAFPVDRARHRARVRQEWDMPVVDKKTFMSTRPGVFFGGDAAFGPANIIWAVEHGHQAAISIHNYCQACRSPSARRTDVAHQHQDGAARVGVQQQLRPVAAREDAARGACRTASTR
jgi:NADPH-dependent glutamate synthase beta subunit-like oxidoreductase